MDDYDLSKMHRSELEAEIVHMAQIVERFRNSLGGIVISIEDEGDRAYFGSTNDADSLREIESDMLATLNELEMPWMHGTDLYGELRDARTRIAELEVENAALKAQLAEAEANINLKASFIEKTINQLAEAEAQLATVEGENVKLKSPSWFYHPDYTETCQFGLGEVIAYYDLEPGNHVVEVETARSLPSIWCAVRVFSDAEKDELQTDESWAISEHTTKTDAESAILALKNKDTDHGAG